MACERADYEAAPAERGLVRAEEGAEEAVQQAQHGQQAREQWWDGGRRKASNKAADAGPILALLEIDNGVEAGALSQAESHPSVEASGGGDGSGGWSGVDLGETAARAKVEAAKAFAARAGVDALAAERAAIEAEAEGEAEVEAEAGRSSSSHNRTGVSPPPTDPVRFPADRPRTSRDSRRYTPAHAACPARCSGHGQCHRGACRCHPGYSGEGCAEVRPTCEANCSGHGGCNELRGECVCDGGFVGAACTIVVEDACPFGCSAHGALDC